MRYIQIILLIILCLKQTGFSQTNRFNNTYTGNTPGLKNIESVNDGYICLGFEYFSGKIQIFVLKIDTLGDTLWTKHFGNASYDYFHGTRNSFKRNTDGGYSLAGSRNDSINSACLFVKFDQNLDTLWTKLYFNNSDFTVFYNHIQTDDYGYAFVGVSTETDADGDVLFVKTDSLGNMQWYKKYGTSAYDAGFCIVSTPDKGYIIGGGSNGYGGGDNYMIKADSLGNLQWTDHYGNPSLLDGGINSIIMTRDSGYVFLASETINESGTAGIYKNGKGCIRKFDKDFNELWYKMYGMIHYQTALSSITELEDGRLVTVKIDGVPNRSKLLFLTPSGDSLWQQGFEALSSTDEQWLMSIKQTQDKGFVMAGVVYGPQQMWVVKTDSCGCDTGGCICNNTEKEILCSDPCEISLFPNPANDVFYISGENISNINIFDLAGNKVFSYSVHSTEKIITIFLSGLGKGIYIVRIKGITFCKSIPLIKY